MASIRDLYTNPDFPGSFSGVSTFSQHVRQSRAKVKSQLQSEDLYTRFVPRRRNFPRRKGITYGAFERYEVDTMDLRRYAPQNSYYKYVLVCLDTLTKYVWVRKQKTKSGLETAQSFESILAEIGKGGALVQSDHGTEFYSPEFTAVCQRWNMKHYSTFTDRHASQVERFNRNLIERFFRYEMHVGAFVWTDVIDRFVRHYNHSIHSTTKFKPVDAKDSKAIQNIVRHRLLDPDKFVLPPKDKKRIFEGDFVRIPTIRHMLHKKSMAKYTQQIFRVVKYKLINGLHTYHVASLSGEEVPGYFTHYELVKVQPPT